MPWRARWWVLFALMLAVSGAWALATPRLAGPDEPAHAIRAVGAARGHLLGDFVLGPFGYVMKVSIPTETCRAIPDPNLACNQPSATPAQHTDVYTYQFRNPPPYYVVVGLPSLLFTGVAGVYVMRLVSAAIASALLASALASAIESERRVAVLGVFVAATPVAWFLAGQINPNGMEIAAAICLWSSTIAIATASGQPSPRLVRRAGVALTLLVVARGLSPAYALVVLAASASLAGRDRIPELGRRNDVRRWLAAGVAGTALTAMWVAIAGFSHNQPRSGTGLVTSVGSAGRFLLQAVGDKQDLGVSLPVVGVLWGIVAVGLVTLAITKGTRREVVAIAGLLAVALLLPITTDGFNLPPLGFGWQGRYGLPLLAGVAVIASSVRRVRIAPGVWRGSIALLGIAQLLAFGIAQVHWAS